MSLYVPLPGSVFVSTNLAVLVAETLKTWAPFDAFTSEIFIDLIVEPLMYSETRWPAVPVNVAVPVAPEDEIVTVAGDPPGVIENVTAAALPPRNAATRTARAVAKKTRVEVRRPTASQSRPPPFLVLPPYGVTGCPVRTRST